MTVGELPFGEDGEPIENATFDNFGDEADDEDNADDEPFYLPEEDATCKPRLLRLLRSRASA